MKPSNRFRKRSLATSAAALAAAQTFTATPGHAEIVWSGVIDQQIAASSDKGGNDTFKFTELAPYSPPSLIFTYDSKKGSVSLFLPGPYYDQVGAQGAITESFYIAPLAPNTLIDDSLTYSSGPPLYNNKPVPPHYPSWVPGERHYLGFRYNVTPYGADYYYVWVDLTLEESGTSAIIHSWAYESNLNQGIQAGAIPEPTLPALLGAAVAAGAALRRRRRSS